MSYKYIYLYRLRPYYQFFYKYKYSRRVLHFIKAYINKRHYYKHQHDYQYKLIDINTRTTFPHNALWSSPGSGNHWVRFIAEYLTGHPTSGSEDNPRDKPIFTNRFPSAFHPLAHVSSKRPHILYKSHKPYSLLNDSTIILLVRNVNELIARYNIEESNTREKWLRYYIKLIKGYDEFSGAKMLIYYEDLLSNPEREILRIKHFLGTSDSRCKTFMNYYDYYARLSKQPIKRIWTKFDSGLNFKFHLEKTLEKDHSHVQQNANFFHQLLAKPEYQKVKPYIARYL